MSRKVYVDVTAQFDTDGKIIPLSIIWEDGREYEVDRVLDVRRVASLKAGGVGMRYTCRICNKECYLFMEENRWFVEGKLKKGGYLSGLDGSLFLYNYFCLSKKGYLDTDII